MITREKPLGAVEMPQSTVENAQLLETEVSRLDVDIQACRGVLSNAFVTSWELWRDTALALAEQAQKSTWYEVPAGALWTLVRQAFSGDGIRDQMAALTKWRSQAKSKGCGVTGPDPPKPPMPMLDKVLWGVGGLFALGIVGMITYGVVTRQGPMQIVRRITR